MTRIDFFAQVVGTLLIGLPLYMVMSDLGWEPWLSVVMVIVLVNGVNMLIYSSTYDGMK